MLGKLPLPAAHFALRISFHPRMVDQVAINSAVVNHVMLKTIIELHPMPHHFDNSTTIMISIKMIGPTMIEMAILFNLAPS